MTTAVLFFVLLKATVASFSGFGSLPQLRRDLVEDQQVLSDETLNRAVLVARTTPGPMGLFIVTLGYEVAGIRGALAGWLALAAPAVFVIGLSRMTNGLLGHPRLKGGISGLVLASAILIVLTGIPLARELLEAWGALLSR